MALALQEPLDTPSADLADRVMSSLEASPERLLRIGEARQRWVPRHLPPLRQARWKPAIALAAAAVLLLAIAPWLLLPRTVKVEFSFEAPLAREVAVVGDWNGWDPTVHRLVDPDGDGVWSIRLRLKRSTEPRYQFVVDGLRWSPDPKAELQVDDGFGGISSVLQI